MRLCKHGHWQQAFVRHRSIALASIDPLGDDPRLLRHIIDGFQRQKRTGFRDVVPILLPRIAVPVCMVRILKILCKFAPMARPLHGMMQVRFQASG